MPQANAKWWGLRLQAAISILFVALILPPVLARADEEADPEEEAQTIVEAVRDSAVRVTITLRFDRGEAPSSLARTSRWSGGLEALVLEKRGLELGGWVLAPDRVLVPDLQLHPRFVVDIRVVRGEGRPVSARPVAYLRDADGMILGLEQPLEGTRPLLFDARAEGPYVAVRYGRSVDWTFGVRSVLSRFRFYDDGRRTADVWEDILIATSDGTPVGASFTGELELDDAWRGSPLDWPQVSAAVYAEQSAKLETIVRRGLLRAHLRFRSPKKDQADDSPFSFMRDESEESTDTEMDATALLLDDTRILVLADLEPAVTARLEAIELHAGDDRVVPARHVYSLKDYGAFLAELSDPLEGALVLSSTPPQGLRDKLLLVASLTFRAERRVAFFAHARIQQLGLSWEEQVLPIFAGEEGNEYLFLPEGELVVLPILRRSQEARRPWEDKEPVMLPVLYLRPLLEDPEPHADLSNIPLAAAKEGRLAWLGVELQSLDRELARANDVAHLTQDGKTGALVSFVYPGSPAAEAGIVPGAILLRLHVPDRPKPIAVGGSTDEMGRLRELLGDLGDIPDELRDQFPSSAPWPSAESAFNKTLTSIGFDRPFTVEYVVDGEVRKQDFTVVEGPPHFEAAPLYEAEELGLTVKDLTYEVRRYFQLDDDAPGVVVAEVERGKAAAVSGIRNYEIVTRVNGKAVEDVGGFETAISAEGEIQLTLRGKTRDRVVKLRAP